MPNFFLPRPRPRITIPPELLSKAALLAHLGISEDELKKIWWFREKMYQEFEIPKGQGQVRTIYAPDDRLKFLQHQLVPLLNQLYRVRNPVHGFVQNKSIKTNAQAHLRRRFILNIDLKSFFPSITENRVIGVLKSIGIDTQVAETIARISCYESYLPQGAPTSPILSNMICFRLDKELFIFSKKVRCIYTRYADDITFSSHQPMTPLFYDSLPAAGHFLPDLLSKELQTIIQNNGFEINIEKCHYADRNSRKMVTGIKVNEFLNVDRRFVRNIRATLHSIEKAGIAKAQEKFANNYPSKSDLTQYLRGKITWLRHIRGQDDPVFRRVALQFNSIFSNQKIELKPSKNQIRDRAIWVLELTENIEGTPLQGTAFFLKNVGLVTAAHCVKGVEQVIVYHPTKPSNRATVKVEKVDTHRDLAILKHDIPITDYFELEYSTETLEIGDELLAAGYPSFGPGDGLNIRTGTVSSTPIKCGIQYIEVTQKLAQGMSGGPLLNNNYEVTGIIHKGGPGEARDFAIHCDVLKEWLTTIPSTPNNPIPQPLLAPPACDMA